MSIVKDKADFVKKDESVLLVQVYSTLAQMNSKITVCVSFRTSKKLKNHSMFEIKTKFPVSSVQIGRLCRLHHYLALLGQTALRMSSFYPHR